MKKDVLLWSEGKSGEKLISKETLNHRLLVKLVSGMNVYTNTREAFLAAYEALGIDIINRVPVENAPMPSEEGITRRHPHLPYSYSRLGIYDTVMCNDYPLKGLDEVYNLDFNSVEYSDLLVPVPHSCDPADIRMRQDALGDTGLYYPMLYTTLFMWGVEYLGYELFFEAALTNPDKFNEKFILPAAKKSAGIVEQMAEASESPFIYLHDDLASASGPLFAPEWYDEYIFPHYLKIFEPAKRKGKKIVFVADGNMDSFLERLTDCGVDGIMFENPATNLDKVIEVFSTPGRFLIGGIDTKKLSFGTPDEVRKMVLDLDNKTRNIPGFAISSCGGLHDTIPLANLDAYFEARVVIGATPADWKTRGRM